MAVSWSNMHNILGLKVCAIGNDSSTGGDLDVRSRKEAESARKVA